jgi:hypothetical protein
VVTQEAVVETVLNPDKVGLSLGCGVDDIVE